VVKNKDKTYTYLALGDSYTIGEAVPYEECFPAQVVAMLHAKGVEVEKPVIIATTGWTTDELIHAINERNLTGTFDIVTLLIGVNNQYRGRPLDNYKTEFTELLEKAIAFAGGNTNRVIVVSIPDWGITPFGEKSGRDHEAISQAIDAFNAIGKEVSGSYGVEYINITPHSRLAKNDLSLVAADGLHPSGIMYTYWAEQLSKRIQEKVR
jgi:lysophospholipase L1-like esterase